MREFSKTKDLCRDHMEFRGQRGRKDLWSWDYASPSRSRVLGLQFFHILCPGWSVLVKWVCKILIAFLSWPRLLLYGPQLPIRSEAGTH